MSNFDAAIALNQAALNQATASIYQKVYPNIFTGSQAVNQLGIQTVQWDIAQSPQFNLSPTSLKNSLAVVSKSLWEENGQKQTAFTREEAGEAMSSSLPTFEMDMPVVNMKLVPQTGSSYVINLTGVVASCYMQVSGNTVSLVPQKITADPQSNSTVQFFVNLIILPGLKTTLQNLLSGLTIPAFNLAGVALSYPSINIINGYMIAAVNLATSGTPAPVTDADYTSSGFSILVSQNLLQASGANQGKPFSDSGSKGSHWAGIDWHYSLNITNPQLSIDGTDLKIGFSLTGSVGATAYILHIPIGLNFDAEAVPTPTATCSIIPVGNTLEIVSKSVSTFTVLVVPSGNISSKIAGWMIEFVVQAVAASVAPVISQFLGGINFSSIDLPVYQENVGGTFITMTPSNLSVSNVSGYLAFGGDLVLS